MNSTTRNNPDVEKRDEEFSQRIRTAIWQDTATPDNPYVADKSSVHGYNVLDISQNLSFSESIFLNLKGELPNPQQTQLLDASLSALSNLGPRHAAVRAVMNAAVSKTQTQNLLPLGLAVASGEYLGAAEVEKSVRFIRKHLNKPAEQVATKLLASYSPDNNTNTVIAPGFGSRFGDIDRVATQMAQQLLKLDGSSTALAWASDFCQSLQAEKLGWLLSGLAAASFADLGLSPKASAGLFQIAIAPGMLAHGLELSNKPLTEMPFVSDSNYIYTGGSDD